MFHIPLNEAESILEPYYDGGDSYNDHQKYSRLPLYKMEPEGCASQIWCALSVKIRAEGLAVLERDCQVDMAGYDYICLYWNASDRIKLRLWCNEVCVVEADGAGHYDKIQGEFQQQKLQHIRYELYNPSDLEEVVLLFYLGAANSRRKFESSSCQRLGWGSKNAEKSMTKFYWEWEGCFAEGTPSIQPYSEVLLREEEADALRDKMVDPTFQADYKNAKRYAEALMGSTPEKQIRRVLGDGFRTTIPMIKEAGTLAFVGFVERDEAMLKLACRYALSIASCEYWCSDEMETAPTITWYHRSFNERSICMALGYVLEFAGTFLSWHGRNILYQALILKGLARFEADFMTMEYIRHMNQGIAFEVGYIMTLLTLSRRFPRYRIRLEEAEKDLHEMLDACVLKDGGMLEGAGYWQYSMLGYLCSSYMLARYHGRSLKDYLQDKLSATANFGLAMLSEDGIMRKIGDVTGSSRYLKVIANTMTELTQDRKWYRILEQSVDRDSKGEIQDPDENKIMEYVMGKTLGQLRRCQSKGRKALQVFPATGYVLWKGNGFSFFGVSGPSYSHCHGDKGHFTIEKGGKEVIVDRGVCSYERAGGAVMGESWMHNLAVIWDEGRYVNQQVGQGYHARLLKAAQEGEGFVWQTDTTEVWDARLVQYSCRTVRADGKGSFWVTDQFLFSRPLQVSFHLHVYDPADVYLHPVDWSPVGTECIPYGLDCEEQQVYMYRMWSEPRAQICITTEIVIR